MARGGGRGGGGSGGGFGGGGRAGGSSFGGSRGGGSRLGGGTARGRGGPGRTTGSGSNRTGSYPRGGFGFGPYFGPRPIFGGYGGYGRRYRRPGAGCFGCGGGCLSNIILIFVVMLLFNFAWSMVPGTNRNTAVDSVRIENSTIKREPIEKGLVKETPYYEDKVDWIRNPSTLEKGLKHFYNKTNVQPFVYITDNINGETNPDPEEIDQFAGKLYDKLFDDEAHLLLVHFENYDHYQYEYSYHTIYGSQAKVLMDQEAENILFDYLDYNYARDLTEEEYFSESFSETADRIMDVTKSPWIPAITIVGVAVVLSVLYNWWKNALNKPDDKKGKKKQNKEVEGDFEDFDF